MNEFKPCPFCGEKAYTKEFAKGCSSKGQLIVLYEVGCKNCKIFFRSESRFTVENGKAKELKNGYEETKNAWNRRA